MSDEKAIQNSAVQYWERRRPFFNLAIVPPAAFSYLLATFFFTESGSTRRLDGLAVALMFLAAAVGANVFYSLAYVLELLFGGDAPNARWLKFGRSLAFIAVTLLAMTLAMTCGREIANIQYGMTP